MSEWNAERADAEARGTVGAAAAAPAPAALPVLPAPSEAALQAATTGAASSGAAGGGGATRPLRLTRDAVLADSGARDAVELAPGAWAVRGPCRWRTFNEWLESEPDACLRWRRSDSPLVRKFWMRYFHALVNCYKQQHLALHTPGGTRSPRPLAEAEVVRSPADVHFWKGEGALRGGAPERMERAVRIARDARAPFPSADDVPMSYVYFPWPPPDDAFAALEGAPDLAETPAPIGPTGQLALRARYTMPDLPLTAAYFRVSFVEELLAMPLPPPTPGGSVDVVSIGGERYVRVQLQFTATFENVTGSSAEGDCPAARDSNVDVITLPGTAVRHQQRVRMTYFTNWTPLPQHRADTAAATVIATPTVPARSGTITTQQHLQLAHAPVRFYSWHQAPALSRLVACANPSWSVSRRGALTALAEFARAAAAGRVLVPVPDDALVDTLLQLRPPRVRASATGGSSAC